MILEGSLIRFSLFFFFLMNFMSGAHGRTHKCWQVQSCHEIPYSSFLDISKILGRKLTSVRSFKKEYGRVAASTLRLNGGQHSAWVEDKLNNLFTDDLTSAYSSSAHSKKLSRALYPVVERTGGVADSNRPKKSTARTRGFLGGHSKIETSGAAESFVKDVSSVGIDQSWVRKRIDSHFDALSFTDKPNSRNKNEDDVEYRSRSRTPDDIADVLNGAFSTENESRSPFPTLSHTKPDTGRVIRKLQSSLSLTTASSPPQKFNVRKNEQDEDNVMLGHGHSDDDPTLLLPNLKVAKADPLAADRMFQTVLCGRLRSATVLTQYADFLASVRKDHASAERHYREALGIRSDYAPALCGLGSILLESRRELEELERICLLAVRHAPRHPPTLCLYGRWLETVMLKPEQAEEYYRKAVLESKRLYSPALIALADLLRFRKDYDGAEAAYVEASSISPDDPTALYRCGHMFLYEMGRSGEAELHFRKGLEIDGSNVDLLCHYGILLLDFKGDIYQVTFLKRFFLCPLVCGIQIPFFRPNACSRSPSAEIRGTPRRSRHTRGFWTSRFVTWKARWRSAGEPSMRTPPMQT